MDAYLDIETTGLSRFDDEITLVGVGLSQGSSFRVVQLLEATLTANALMRALSGVSKVFTFNGSRFDLPFISQHLEVDLADEFQHHDLMLDCHQRGLRGGFKSVEVQLGIRRRLQGLTGADAVDLWYEYKLGGDRQALETLLEYNREDVANLRDLRRKLVGRRRERFLSDDQRRRERPWH